MPDTDNGSSDALHKEYSGHRIEVADACGTLLRGYRQIILAERYIAITQSDQKTIGFVKSLLLCLKTSDNIDR